MKKSDLRNIKARSAFRSLYPCLVSTFSFSDNEIDFFLDHPVFNSRLLVCNFLCEVASSNRSLFNSSSISLVFDLCYILLEGNLLPF